MWKGTRNELLLANGQKSLWSSAGCGVVAVTALSATLLHGGFPAWRVLVMVSMWLLMISAQFTTVRLASQRPELLDRAVVGLHVIAQVYLVGVTAVTGGLHSPMLAAIGSSTALPIVFFGAHSVSRRLTISLVLLFIAMAVLPTAWLGPSLSHGHYVVASVIAFMWTVTIIAIFVSRIHHATMEASCALDRLNEEQVAASAEQLQRLQSVGSKVAHELKNPLASIKGLVQLVARSTESDKNRERLEVMQGEIARMETILSEYLSFSRPLEELRPQVIDLAELVADAVAVIGGRAEQGKIAVSIDTRAAKVNADPRRLKEALLNLLANAIEATPATGMIKVSTCPTSDGAMIEVRDTGRGIKIEDLERLGTSFFTTRDGGTGLGVVLAQNVVAQHGGSLHYASAPGRGTLVTIRLPRTPAPASPSAVLSTSSTARPLDPAA